MTLTLFAGGGGGILLKGALKLNAFCAVGLKLENQLRVDSGTLSFVAASAATSFAPTLIGLDARFEGLAWTYFLQSALVLGLWAGKSQSSRRVEKINGRKWIPILAVFLFGIVGSTLGGYVGFQTAKLSPEVIGGLFSKNSLRILSACLTASYIGGTVNFFETAKIVGATGSESMRSLVNLVAGVDIGVMVLYFWFLSIIRYSPLAKILRKREPASKNISPSQSKAVSLPSLIKDLGEVNDARIKSLTPAKTNIALWKYLPPIIVSSIITVTANFIQRNIPIPGVSVIFATLGATIFQNFLHKSQVYVNSQLITDEEEKLITLQNERVQSDTARRNIIANDINMNNSEVVTAQHMPTYFNTELNWKLYRTQMVLNTFNEQSGSVGKFMMGLFYSTIGLGFRFDKIKSIQGPLGILLGVTLACHLFTIMMGSILWNFCVLSLARLGDRSERSGISYSKSKSNRSNIAFASNLDDIDSVHDNSMINVSANGNTNNDNESHRNIARRCSDDSGRVPVIDPNIALDYLIDMDTALVAR